MLHSWLCAKFGAETIAIDFIVLFKPCYFGLLFTCYKNAIQFCKRNKNIIKNLIKYCTYILLFVCLLVFTYISVIFMTISFQQ